MNFGQNLYTWLSTNVQGLALAAIAVVGVTFAIKREFTKMFATLAVLILVAGFVFNTGGVKDLLVNLFNTIFGV